ncbi:hypothetical protein EON77_06825 [bacterium]|nr:MAG: hypothetical protein EON77_06825 [bacterium]
MAGALADAVASVDLVVLGADRGRLTPRLVRLEPAAGISDPRWYASGTDGNGVHLVQDDDLFYGAVVGLGATGIACAYTLSVAPRTSADDGSDVEEMTYELAWEHVGPQLIDLAQANDFVEIALYPHPTGARTPGTSRDACIACTVTTRRYSGASGSSIELAGTAAARGGTRGPSARAYASQGGGALRASATELSVPLEDAERAVAAILDETEALRRDGAPHAGPLTLRFSGPSRHALSPNHGRPSFRIEASLPPNARRGAAEGASASAGEEPPRVVRRLFDVVDASCAGRARPGWSRLHELSGAELGARYPDVALFRKACHAFDPRGTFLNAATRALLWNGGRAP